MTTHFTKIATSAAKAAQLISYFAAITDDREAAAHMTAALKHLTNYYDLSNCETTGCTAYCVDGVLATRFCTDCLDELTHDGEVRWRLTWEEEGRASLNEKRG